MKLVRKHRSGLSTLVAAALAITLAGCAFGGRVIGPHDAGGGGEPTTIPSEDPSVEIFDAMVEDIDSAVAITDAFWATHWSEFFTGEYVSPNVIGLYDGNDPATAPSCGGEPLGPGNAFFCSENYSVQWDASLMYTGYLEGDSWVYLIVAHEWAHAIQEQVPSIVMVAGELQADCLAGATLFGASADGTLLLEEGDQREIASSLSALGDEVAWTDSDGHGDPFERIAWFGDGRSGGVGACLPTQ